ncbi:MAG: Threonine dehydrogenase and related Zn-dependent dehydrogenases [uncultured Chloroflexi bacterium]|uniref:Threonine dehydrogenase and related Zn-dependent dehydrogenases n=1 Tax=uncultured Chloroflexota bacterium TaxID=166587 RepID=A0A6J4GX34_9CHLR|nr:MAG: Threonine dehydrogenase and related Zn-dependent dehydrogenases [uncultured Chloroflexota bacterium]
MRAAVTVAPRRIEVKELPDPTPAPDEALLRVEVAGICGSDLHMFDGTNPYANFPLTQGHEFSARVVALGSAYQGAVKPGDRVTVEPLIYCGECFPCRHGRPNCCVRLKVLGVHTDGAFAEMISVKSRALFPAGSLDAELTALVEPVSIGMQVVTRGQVTGDDTVVVYGAGVIGQATLVCARDRGARVLVVDKLPSRLELARKLGAEATAEAGREDVAKVIADWTNGEGPAVAVDATGVPAVIRAAIDAVAPSGRIVIVGISDQEVSIPVIQFSRKELTIVGSRNNAGVFGQALDLVQRLNDRLRVLVTHRFPLDQAQDALDLALDRPQHAEKVLLTITDTK